MSNHFQFNLFLQADKGNETVKKSTKKSNKEKTPGKQSVIRFVIRVSYGGPDVTKLTCAVNAEKYSNRSSDIWTKQSEKI